MAPSNENLTGALSLRGGQQEEESTPSPFGRVRGGFGSTRGGGFGQVSGGGGFGSTGGGGFGQVNVGGAIDDSIRLRDDDSNVLLDLLLLPEVALFDRSVRGAFYAALKGEGVAGVMERIARGSPFAHAYDFLLDENESENVLGEDVLRAAGFDDPGLLPSLAFELISGPSTYAGIGLLSRIGSAVKAGRVFRVAEALKGGSAASRFGRVFGRGEELVEVASEATAREAARAGLERLTEQGVRAATSTWSLSRRAKEGVLGLRFQLPFTDIGVDAPRWFNVPFLNAVETSIEGVKRSLIGQSVRELTSQAGQIGAKGARQLNEEGGLLGRITGSTFQRPTIDQIEQTKILVQNVGADIAHQSTGALNVMRELHAQYELVADLQDPRLAKFATLLREWGEDGISRELDPARIGDLAQRRLAAFLGEDVAARTREFIASAGSPRKAAVESVAQAISESGLPVTVEQGTAAAIKKVATLNARLGEAASTIKSAYFAADDAFRSIQEAIDAGLVPASAFDGIGGDVVGLFDESTGLLNDKLDLQSIEEFIGSDAHARLVSRGTIREGDFEKLAHWTRVIHGPFDEKIQSVASTLVALGKLPPEMRKALDKGSLGVGEIQTVVASNISSYLDAVDSLHAVGKTPIDPKDRATLRMATEKLAKILTRHGEKIPEDLEQLAAVHRRLASLGEDVTEADLLHTALYIADSILGRQWTAEQTSMILSNYIDYYASHVTTDAAKEIINSVARKAYGGNNAAVDLFFTRGREFTNRTVAEVNAIVRQKGTKSTLDVPFDPFGEVKDLTQQVIKDFDAADPKWLRKLEKVDPRAAQFFQADLSMALQARLDAAAKVRGVEVMRDALFKEHRSGGIASRVFAPTSESEVAQVKQAVEAFFKLPDGTPNQALMQEMFVIPTGGLFHGEPVRFRDVFSNSYLQSFRDSLPDVAHIDPRVSDEIAAAQAIAADVRFNEAVLKGEKNPALVSAEDLATGSWQPVVGERYAIVPRELYGAMVDMHKRMISPLQTHAVSRLIFQATRLWKGYTTLPNPGFHARNVASNTFFAAMAGLGPNTGMRRIREAMDLAIASTGRGAGLGGKTFRNISGETIGAAELLQQFKKHGLIDPDFNQIDLYLEYSGDVVRRNRNMPRWLARAAFFNPGSEGFLGPIGRAFRTFGAQNENVFKMAVALDQWHKGADMLSAVRHAKKYMVDYDSHLLTNTERGFFRALIPFYTFWRRNLPLSLENIFGSPRATTFFGKAIRAFDETPEIFGTDELPDKLVPDYVKDFYGVPIRVVDGQPQYFLFKNWLPTGDVAELAEGLRNIIRAPDGERGKIVRDMASRITPLVKVPVEILTNFSTFSGKDIERFEGQEVEVFGMTMSPKQAHLVRSIVFLNNIDKLNIFGVARSGERGERREVPAPQRLMQYFLGLRTYASDPIQESRRSRFEIERRKAELKGELNRLVRDFRTPNRREQMDSIRDKIRELNRELVDMNRVRAEFQRRNRSE